MKLIAFGASSSKSSINKSLASYAASLVSGASVEILDLNDYELPLFSEDVEKEIGQPQAAKDFQAKITEADALIISFAEHNGSYSAAYKNLFDWMSRIDNKVFQNKPAVYLATSPGPGGAASVLQAAELSAPHFGADLRATVSVPNFYDVFELENSRFKDAQLAEQIQVAVSTLAAV